MDTGQLKEAVENGKALQMLLKKNPEVLEFLRLLNETKEIPVITQKADRLIRTREAAKILCIDPNKIRHYVQSGKLRAYKTDESNQRKFWLSEVMALPERMMEVQSDG